MRSNAVPSSPRKRKARTARQQNGTTCRVLLSEIETVEETVETENATCNEESETNDIDTITKQDVATQTNEIETSALSLFKSRCLQSKSLEVMTPLSSFILVL